MKAQRWTLAGWLRWLAVPQSASWLMVYVNTPEVRFPIYVPVPVAWIRDIVRGARLSLAAADRVTGGRINSRVMKYIPPSVDWYTADLDLERSLPALLYGLEQVIDGLLGSTSYTLVEINDEATRIAVRIV